MDYASTASGEHEGKPLLVLSPAPDQDHPDTMNQIIWSLMDILNSQSIAGVPFDPENPNSYNRVRVAISQMIAASVIAKSSLAEVRIGTDDAKFVTSLGATAASGNYSQYISVTTTPAPIDGGTVNIAASAMGGLIIASASATSITLPALADVPRVGAAYTFLNLAAVNVTVSRASTNTILGSVSNTAVVLRPGQQITLVKISGATWAALGDKVNNFPFQKEFVGAWINYVSKPGAGFGTNLYEIAHGLGSIPKLVIMQLECLVADGNYAVGKVTSVYANQPNVRVTPDTGTPANTGFASTQDATNFSIAFDSNHGMTLHEWNANANFRLTNNAWKWRVLAWA